MEVSGDNFHIALHIPCHGKKWVRRNTLRLVYGSVTGQSKSVGLSADQYPIERTIVFGYGDEIWGTVPDEFDSASVTRLDRKEASKEDCDR
jgi:hypothetical protein